MWSTPRERFRRLRGVPLLVAVGFVSGCGRGAPPAEEQAQEPVVQAASAEQAPDTAPALHRFLPDEMRRSTRAETFPHGAHVQIDCSVCHQVAQGHGSHATVECAACHRASAMATVRALSPADCETCHHVTQQTWTCEHCHGTPGAYESAQELDLEVWAAPRRRVLHFEHGWHETVACAECHRAAPSLSPESCAACHESHHVATVRCQSCHTPSPLAAHDVNAHVTCSGAGCHRAPLVEAIANTRAVCLVCHQEQESHEPDGNCVACHPVRPVRRTLGP